MDGDLGSCFWSSDNGMYHICRWIMLEADQCQAFGRYSMGWWPSKIIVLLNLIQMIGYCLIDCVVGGQILSAVSPNGISVEVGT